MIIIHDMLKVVDVTPTISDDELAAVMAALALYTEPKQMVAKPKGKTSGWKKDSAAGRHR